MAQAIMSYIRAIPNTQMNNRILFSIPVVNFLRRYALEQQWFQNIRAETSEKQHWNDQQRIFQKDYLMGMGVQTVIALASASTIFFFQFPVISLSAFTIFGINAALSLPFHFSQDGFKVN